MRKAIVALLAVSFLLACGSAMATYQPTQFEDYSWWAERESTPRPVKDPVHPGYWWWPTNPDSNVGDEELWGNRGVVYHIWEPEVEPPVAPPPAPPTPPAVIDIEAPVLDHVLFDFDKAYLKPEGQAVADDAVSFMSRYPDEVTATIEGHTDSIGSDAYNMALGQRRANAVKTYMVNQGISPTRIDTVSYGESQPVVPNTTPANRKLNRRAVFNFHIDQDAAN
jgi:outer membrane protein OmpA-like peptidoglycan-associated protein